VESYLVSLLDLRPCKRAFIHELKYRQYQMDENDTCNMRICPFFSKHQPTRRPSTALHDEETQQRAACQDDVKPPATTESSITYMKKQQQKVRPIRMIPANRAVVDIELSLLLRCIVPFSAPYPDDSARTRKEQKVQWLPHGTAIP